MKRILILALIILFNILVLGCGEVTTSEITTITTTEEQTTTNSTMTNQVQIGTQFHYPFELVTSLWTRYQFVGDTYYIFTIDFPEDVYVEHRVRDFLDQYEFIDRERVTIQSDGFGEQSIFEYLQTELSKTLSIPTNYTESTEETLYFMDDLGNILRVQYISETEVEIRLVRGVNIIYEETEDGYEGYFCFSQGSVALDLEASRNRVINGCPACVVSDIVDGEYTYTYLGHVFKITEEEAILIEGYYHFQLTHVEEE